MKARDIKVRGTGFIVALEMEEAPGRRRRRSLRLKKLQEEKENRAKAMKQLWKEEQKHLKKCIEDDKELKRKEKERSVAKDTK